MIFLHGVQAEVTAVGENGGQEYAHLVGLDSLLPGAMEVGAEPEVVLDLDEQVSQPDRAGARVEPAVQFGEAFRAFEVGMLGLVSLEPPPVVVEGHLPVIGDALQEPIEGVRKTRLQLIDRAVGVGWESRACPEGIARPLPVGARQEERFEPAEVLCAVHGEVSGPDLVAYLEEQRAFPAVPVDHAVAADERLERRRREVDRGVGRQATAPCRSVFTIDP